MGDKHNVSSRKPRRPLSIFAVIALCCFFYLLGSWQKTGFRIGDGIALELTKRTYLTVPPKLGLGDRRGDLVRPSKPPVQKKVGDIKAGSEAQQGSVKVNKVSQQKFDAPELDFKAHHGYIKVNRPPEQKVDFFKQCDAEYRDYTPCQEQDRAMRFPRENMIYRERHCPTEKEKLRCLIPPPKGYKTPFPWPKSRDYAYYANVPYKSLTVQKAVQNWVQYQGDVFKFPGGGTMFPQGADAFIDELARVIPMTNGTVRTALDTGCGVASWGAYVMKRNVLPMSFAPKDNHEAQVQFALERGVPAVVGVLGSMRLPYPARAFDMTQCSRCLIPWTANDGMYLMEVDRVLRPGGYWVLSGPPINWRTYYKTWKRSKKDLHEEQQKIEDLAELLCWEKKYEKGDTAIWRKRINDRKCRRNSTSICRSRDADEGWEEKMVACITPYPKVMNRDEVAGGELKPFPARLHSVPPRIANKLVPITAELFIEDDKLWKKRMIGYKKINKMIGTTRYRNVMDMNAQLGGFAAALDSTKSWVMNVVPIIADNTLGIIYERGLIGIYHEWCEGFSTYPRTYDLIHAAGLFSLYKDKCNFEDILLEMDRILRPEGAIIVRDEVDVMNEVRKIARRMRWEVTLRDHEDGPLVPEKIMVGVKPYWLTGGTNHSTSAKP
ncbi:hypothetical protein MLD38_010649 [Melastoma candidum]|uniref:Uncharacterized protein n=1 Tax=Melastoma candidum TaxID=119954 RepID=A0ACB9R8V2_9MYRT|nr:hypothetical protein MLD38_010649 [Melastoma candidum]